MNTALLSPTPRRLDVWAVRGGLALARWGRRREQRRTDRDRLLRRMEARATAEAARAERDRAMRAAFPGL